MNTFFQNKRLTLKLTIILSMIVLVVSSCGKDPEPDPEIDGDNGKIHFNFDFVVDGKTLKFDSMEYINAAGNEYLVYDVQYFISRVTIYKDGVAKILNGWENEHYIDTDIPSTLGWDVYDEITPGDYDSINFVFGFIDADNQSFMFVNPPESNMVWPEYSGGGYHYMKLDGKWKATTGSNRGFSFHLGRGQIYDSNNKPISYIDNSFVISLKNSDFSITKAKYTNLLIRMHVDQWFTNPENYDHNVWGGDIMQTQDAMAMGCKNGWNVFELIKQ